MVAKYAEVLIVNGDEYKKEKSTVRKSKKNWQRFTHLSAGFDEIINLLIGKVEERILRET